MAMMKLMNRKIDDYSVGKAFVVVVASVEVVRNVVVSMSWVFVCCYYYYYY